MTRRARLRRIKLGVEVVITPPQSAITRSTQPNGGLDAHKVHTPKGHDASNTLLRGHFVSPYEGLLNCISTKTSLSS